MAFAGPGRSGPVFRAVRAAATALAALPLAGLAGCASYLGGMAADTLSTAVLDQDDPEVIESGLPAYLLLVDGLIGRNPGQPAMLAAGAELYALYGSRFVDDAVRSVAMTAKARDYGRRAICLAHRRACDWDGLSHDRFTAELETVGRRQVRYLYAYAVSWLSHLDATSSDWSAVGELPWVQASMERVAALDESYDNGGVQLYLGMLHSLRPPALGGRLDLAREHFERSIAISGGADLSAKVEYARRYARMVFDRELHDRLLTEVLEAPARASGRTLFNVLAQQDAVKLLESSGNYF